MISWNPAKAALDTDELLASNEINFHSSHHPSCFGLSTGFLPYKTSVGVLNKLPDSGIRSFPLSRTLRCARVPASQL
jgi:hypothetical protein